MASSSTCQACTLCATPGGRVCDRCKSSRYCSKECQVDDWDVHRLLCKSFSEFDISTRPSKTHFRGIVFPQDNAKPEIAWLDCPWHKDEDDSVQWQHPDTKPFLGPKSFAETQQIQTDALLQQQLPNTISICYRDRFLVDGSKPNKSIAAVLATLPGPYHDWRGPMVAVGKQGQGMDPPACRDLDMSDFRYIADYLISYGHWALDVETMGRTPAYKHIKGVGINCLGDRQAFGKPQYEAVDISPQDPIFSAHWQESSDIAKRIDFPIFTRRCPPNLRWTRKNPKHEFSGLSPFTNQDATFLHLCCDPQADSFPSGPGWSWAGWQWQNDVGSILVVRQDRKPLAPMHVEALCAYCLGDVQPLMGHSMGEYAPDEPLTREAVLTMICRPTFSISWSKFVERKRKEGGDVSAPDPYEG